MGLFKKKKRKEDNVFVSQSSARAGQVHGRYGAQQDVARLKEEAHQDRGRPSTEKHSPDSGPGNESVDADIKSSRLKVRLRKSLSQIFSDKTQIQIQKLHSPVPRLSTEPPHDRRPSVPFSSASEMSMKSPDPNTLGHNEEHWPIDDTHGSSPAMPIFRSPFDAPPLPPSPSPQQLDMLESNISQFSASDPFHDIPISLHPSPASPKATVPASPKFGAEEPSSPKPASLFARRRPEHYLPHLSLPDIHAITGQVSAKQTRPSFTSSRDTSISLPPAYRFRRTSSVVTAQLEDDLLTPDTSTSIADIRRKMSDSGSLLGKLIKYNLHGSEMDEKRKGDEASPTPDIDFHIHFHIHIERVIAGSRLCDVLRTLFASNGRVGVSEECKRHLEKCKTPRLMEVSIGLRMPMLASYADDYPHGKFYSACLEEIDERIDLKSQDAPLEKCEGGKAPFHRLDFPDNYFDVVMSGSAQLILTLPEWPAFISEMYRILKPGGWIDFMCQEATLYGGGPRTRAYNAELLHSIKRRNMYANPGNVLPQLLRSIGFKDITRAQVLLPSFWRNLDENQVSIRNARTGEETFMTMSEIGDRVSTLMHGFWEEMHGAWDDDVEDFAQRNKIRRKEAETTKTWSATLKVGARKRGKLRY